ncbi:MAG: MATE family efflux transporter [Eubacteriales bacterium]
MEKNKMGIKPIPGLITKMALPVIFSMLIQALYNVVDSIFVSRVSEEALTAVSLAFPLQLIVIAAFVGLSTGISSAISRKLGEKDHHSAMQVAQNGLFIAAVLFAVVAIGGYFSAGPVFNGFSIGRFTYNGFTENQTIITYGITYVKIVMLFSFGSIFTQAGMSVFRGTGDMIKPTISQLIGAILNIILDPILIFGWGFIPAMGVKGAAIATVTAQIISMLYIWITLLGGKSIIKLKIKEFKLSMKAIQQILVVGIPSAIMQGLASVMLFFMNIILSRFGDSAIAVMGVYFKIQSMVFMPVFGLSIGTMPVVGYNYGAKNKDRIKKAIKFSATVAAIYMTLCLVLLQILPAQLLGMFNASSEMLAIGVPAFRSISLIFPLIAITIILTTAFQAFGKAYYSLIVSVVRQLVVLIPVAFMLARYSNVDLVWFAFIIAEVIGLIVVTVLFSNVYRNSVGGWDVALEAEVQP